MIKLTDEQGNEYEFRGEYRDVKEGDWVLAESGMVTCASGDWPDNFRIAIVHPVRKTFISGGVEWEIINHRSPKHGDWFRYSGTAVYSMDSKSDEYEILRPVRIVEE